MCPVQEKKVDILKVQQTGAGKSSYAKSYGVRFYEKFKNSVLIFHIMFAL